MRFRSDLLDSIEVVDTWIPVRDGTRLATRVWLPRDAAERPMPAVLEYIPYRLRDGTVLRDELMHPYVAAHGFACVRVDLRGTGDSEGVLTDEYLPLELDDGEDVIGWLAEQRWCTGQVGVIGKSWGGFNGLQLAARRPPQLGGVISVCSTDDRYATDVHFMGGNVLASKMLAWASTMFSANAFPPDPLVVGDRWRAMWQTRLEQTPPYIETWMAHQRRDEYWAHGSVCENFSAIECPVLAVGGFADGYTDAVFRLLAGLTCERYGIVGPWGHQYPHSGEPGPAIGFLQECVRWWNHCLKDRDTGVTDEPMLRVWTSDWVNPDEAANDRPGRWLAEEQWPGTVSEQRFTIAGSRLTPGGTPKSGHHGDDSRFTIDSATLVGLEAGDWCPAGNPSDLPTDQRRDDGRSRCFDSEPLDAPVTVVGLGTVDLRLASDASCGQVAVRVCDVSPDGSSLLVARGVMNLQHATGHGTPAALEPGRTIDVSIPVSACAHRFTLGHRIRLAFSATYWPWLWPAPDPFRLTIDASTVVLRLPVRPDREPEPIVEFDEPEATPPSESRQLAPGGNRRSINLDVDTGQMVVERTSHEHTELVDVGVTKGRLRLERCAIIEGEPTSARVECTSTSTMSRGDWRIRVETRTTMTSDREHFHGTNVLSAYEGDTCVHSAASAWSWPRDHQ